MYQPAPIYVHPAVLAAQERTRQIDRTKTGILLLIFGFLLDPVPYGNYVGDVLVIIGAILVIIGRRPFGPVHSRNVVWSLVLFIVGIGVAIGASLPLISSIVSASVANATGNPLNQAAISQSLSSSFNVLLIGAVVGGAILGLAGILFTYALQTHTGKVLLWTGYVASVAISILAFVIIAPLISNAASQSFVGGHFDSGPISSLEMQQQVLMLLGFIPAIITASAFYLAWSRIKTGEVPPQPPQQTAPSAPSSPAPPPSTLPASPPAPASSGPAPPAA
jgi:MFS family permease